MCLFFHVFSASMVMVQQMGQAKDYSDTNCHQDDLGNGIPQPGPLLHLWHQVTQGNIDESC